MTEQFLQLSYINVKACTVDESNLSKTCWKPNTIPFQIVCILFIETFVSVLCVCVFRFKKGHQKYIGNC